MKTFQIWSEGYVVMEGGQGAQFEGESDGHSFVDAVRNYANTHPGWMQPYEIVNLDKGDIAIWGCRLYDNEDDARRSFG